MYDLLALKLDILISMPNDSQNEKNEAILEMKGMVNKLFEGIAVQESSAFLMNFLV